MVLPNFFCNCSRHKKLPQNKHLVSFQIPKRVGGVLKFCEHAQKCVLVSLSSPTLVLGKLCVLCALCVWKILNLSDVVQFWIVRCKFWTLQICSGDSFLAARCCQKDKKEPIPLQAWIPWERGSRGHDEDDDIHPSMYPKILCMWVVSK
jgi:hypothetical protein